MVSRLPSECKSENSPPNIAVITVQQPTDANDGFASLITNSTIPDDFECIQLQYDGINCTGANETLQLMLTCRTSFTVAITDLSTARLLVNLKLIPSPQPQQIEYMITEQPRSLNILAQAVQYGGDHFILSLNSSTRLQFTPTAIPAHCTSPLPTLPPLPTLQPPPSPSDTSNGVGATQPSDSTTGIPAANKGGVIFTNMHLLMCVLPSCLASRVGSL